MTASEILHNRKMYLDGLRGLMTNLGEDPTREGLIDTPMRVYRAWLEMLSGYEQEPEQILKMFADANSDEMVVVSDIPFTSVCDHNMLPFIGHACVGYLPNGCVVGLSKIPRLVDAFAMRLQVQERLTEEIADAINKIITPKGVGVVIKAKHLCCGCRGVRKPEVLMTTSALRGAFKSDPATRSEFLSLARGE
jgi:GTP cyclohydrolase I